MPLTPEQKRRAEENRAAAVARKNKKRPLDIVSLGFGGTPPPSPPGKKEKTAPQRILVNRSPVMALWGAVVAQHALKVSWSEALSLGGAVAAACAKRKGQALDLYKNDDDEDDEQEAVGLLGFRVRVLMSDDDVRALDAEGRQKKPESVEKTLRAKFGDHFERIKGEFEAVARTHAVDDLNRDDGRLAYDLYAAFRPAVPNGRAGWGAPGELDIAKVRGAAKRDEEEP